MRSAIPPIRLGQTLVAGLTIAVLAVANLPPNLYSRDLAQDYLAARALRDGLDMYTPLPDLSERYFPIRITSMPTPTNHPPVVILLSVPLSLPPYEVVFPLGLLVNVALLLVVGRWLGLSVPGSLVLAAWPPVWWVLFLDQFEVLLLTLAMLGWRQHESGHPWRAGFWFGLAATVKFYPVVFLVPFAARRQFRVLLGAAAVLALGQAVNLAMVGPAGLIHYYREVIPEVTQRYVYMAINASPHGALLRLLGGSADVTPIVDAPGLAFPLAVAVSLLGLAAMAWLHPRAAPLASLVTLPAAWSYQVLLALPEIVRLLRLPRWRLGVVAAAAAASFVHYPLLVSTNHVVVALTGWSGDRAPPVSGLLASIQTAGFLALLFFSLRTRPESEQQPARSTV